MKLKLLDDSAFDIQLSQSPVEDIIKKWFKHLKHVGIPFRPWDYKGYILERSMEEFINDLEKYASKVGVVLDRNRIEQQQYLNELHEVYETNYDGQQQWTDYHEHIHILERKRTAFVEGHYALELNYRHLAGPIKQPFRYEWLEMGTTDIKAGDVFLFQDELGKSPYRYWLEEEPDNIERLCQLSKPWLTVRPKVCISFKDVDFSGHLDPGFQPWWDRFEKDWCAHYQIPKWSHRDSRTVLVVGHIDDWSNLKDKLDQKIWPKRITL